MSGIAGYLLSEGDRRGLDITALLAECNPMYPDARAAAIATEAVAELIDREIPLGALLEDARRIEDNVREMFEKSQSMLPAPEGYDVSNAGDDPMVNWASLKKSVQAIWNPNLKSVQEFSIDHLMN